MTDKDRTTRDHLVKLLRGGQAYRPLRELMQGLTAEAAGRKVQDLPYTLWQQLEHLRFTLHDILDFSRNPDYKEPSWPDDYWPKENTPSDQAALDACIKSIDADMEGMIELVEDTGNDLYAPFLHGSGQTLLREAMLVAEHNAYHMGQIVLMRRLLGDSFVL